MGVGEWIALGGVAAAFLAVGGQLFALARQHRLVRRQARYDELERAYVTAGKSVHAVLDQLWVWSISGRLRVRETARILGDIRQAAGVLKMHQADEAAKAKLVEFSDAYHTITGDPEKGTVNTPTAPQLEWLGRILMEYYSLAGAHLRKIWRRPSKLD